MIAYLQQKGFPEVALHFVKDERTRFNLALESGNIQIAVASAKEIDEKDHWYRLGVEALRQVKNDVMGQFHNSLYLGDVQERVKILENAGHLPLAYVTAKVHGLEDVAEHLAAELGDNVPSVPEGKVPSLLMPPVPVMCGGDWPLLRVMKGIFEGGLDNMGRGGADEDEDTGEVAILEDGEVAEENEEEGGWELEDLELPPEQDTPRASVSARSSVFVAPTPGMPVSQIWIQRSSLAAEHAAAGNFDTAMRLLNRQLGIRNFIPLRSMFLDLHSGSHSYLRAFSSTPVISLAVERGWNESASPNVRGPPALMELKRREMKDNPVRQQELAAYFTHCNLQMPHLRLALQNAMTVCYKARNLATAANFARRLLETNPTIENQAKTARQVLQAAERNMTDAAELNYDFRNPFVTCGATMFRFTEDKRMSLAHIVVHGLCQAKKGSCVLFVILQLLEQMLQGCSVLLPRYDD
ncbi:hypothetical protein GH714_031320 [Hevea brasiliensis]|uniref:Coatomer alpha subunit C-terminal domain-containing protein n=1 Tax=Hevea brasiliensis TaxID=3981 RepID=A0A6A6NDI3_HEVBR|nr:hypothetical protein GH714_031320 [Hevea brasiliensis]